MTNKIVSQWTNANVLHMQAAFSRNREGW